MNKNNRKNNISDSDNAFGSGFWISFTDLLSCLLLVVISFVFILAIKFVDLSKDDSVQKLSECEKELKETKLQYNDLLSTYNSLISDYNSLNEAFNLIKREYGFLENKIFNLTNRNNYLEKQLGKFNKTEEILQNLVNDIHKELVQCAITNFNDNSVADSIIFYPKSNTIHISDQILRFDPGQHEIESLSSRTFISKCVGKILSKKLNTSEARELIDSVFIEGHTDKNPFKGDDRNFKNWNLSAERAIEFWYILKNSVPGLGDITNINGTPLFSVSGYADSRPESLCDNEHFENGIEMCDNNMTKKEVYEKNRRIDIKFKALYLNNLSD